MSSQTKTVTEDKSTDVIDLTLPSEESDLDDIESVYEGSMIDDEETDESGIEEEEEDEIELKIKSPVIMFHKCTILTHQ